MVSRRARVNFGQCFQKEFCEYYSDPSASLHKLITTRGQENLLGSSPQMSRWKMGIFVSFRSVRHRSVSRLVLQLDVVHVICCLFLESVCVCLCVCMREIPSWFKSIVFGNAVCCTPSRTGSPAVDVFILFLFVFSNDCVNWATAHEVSFFSGLYFLSNNLVIKKHIFKTTR